MAEFETDDVEEIIVNLELEGVGEVECEIICIFEYENENYAALTPTDESIEELYFFGIEMTDTNEEGEMEITLTNVVDDDLLNNLSEVFDQIIDETADDDAEAIVEDDSDDEEEDDDDSKWDEFIHKKL